MLTIGLIVILIYLLIMLVAVTLKKDHSLANFTWGGGVVLLTLLTFFFSQLYLARHILITALICLWGLRLTIYFYIRLKPGPNPKYLNWQNKWGNFIVFLISLSWIFGQSILLFIMSTPSIVINLSTKPGLNWLDIAATITWLIGFYFETVGDYQLYQFMKNPSNKSDKSRSDKSRNKILNTGLWRYSRHPNYFGEIVMWWSVYLIAISVSYGIFTIIAPLTITILLRYITGVPAIENQMSDNPKYQKYQKTTNMLIPWWPKNRS